MIRQGLIYAGGVAVLSCGLATARAAEPPQSRELWNGRDLSGRVDVNTAADTWTVRDGVLVFHFRNIRILELPRGILSAEQTARVVGR